MKRAGVRELASADRGFDEVTNVKRLDPRQL